MQGQVAINRGPVDTTHSPHAALRPLSFTAVRLSGGFWSRWQKTNRVSSLEHGYTKLVESGVISNFEVASGRREGPHRNMFFADTDLFKWLEAASYEMAMQPSDSLEKRVNDAIGLIAETQMDDGYINTYFQITGIEDRWRNAENHSLFCVGHLLQAAVAHARCTGSTTLLQVAIRLADHVDSVFGPGKLESAPDHPGVEVALVELFRETGELRHLELARYFIDMRGKGLIQGGYFRWAYLTRALYDWDKVPIREATEAAGHAVMQVYLLAGVADLFLESGDQSLMESLVRLWEDITTGKLSINGGVGGRPKGEAFGLRYELPNEQGYNETCAQIGSVMWNWRMLLATGEARYADLMEWTLYNGVLSGVSLDGTDFFYGNTLLSRHGEKRHKWSRCACCPPNVMRTLASVHSYFATTTEKSLQLHLYDSGSLSAEVAGVGTVRLAMETRYPWDGLIRLLFESSHDVEWELRLRIPAWCKEATITVNGESERRQEAGSYAAITRKWQRGDTVELRLSMAPVMMAAHPRVESTRGSAALIRGPLLYCIENTDQESGVEVMNCTISTGDEAEAQWRPDLLEGVTVLKVRCTVEERAAWDGKLYRDYADIAREPHGLARSSELTAIPYYAWANRNAVPMRVWIPVD